jgi:hypothetical protein
MIRATWGLFAVLLTTGSSISYFKYDRQIGPVGTSGRHYAVVDETVWAHALPNLDDLRLNAGGQEIPYTTRTMWGTRQTEQRAVRLLQPGTLGGKAEFVLDMSGVSEYDRVSLILTTKNYVAHALVEGQDDLHGTHWAKLGTTTLFDLSDEKLGHNTTLQIPVSTYKYLRVTLDGPIRPWDIQSATAGIERAQEAVWRELSSEPQETQERKDTVLTFAVSENIPVERLTLAIDPAQGNFQREIELQTDKGSTTGIGEIRRIHMQRDSAKIDVDQTWISLNARGQGKLRAVIHNGDDAPLKITRARLQQYERRIYFDCAAGTAVGLYYGDAKLNAPVYDYAKLFQMDANAAQVPMGAEEKNSVYSGRPDDRPWSERHPAVLWTAILAAVALLGGIAVRSIKAATS